MQIDYQSYCYYHYNQYNRKACNGFVGNRNTNEHLSSCNYLQALPTSTDLIFKYVSTYITILTLILVELKSNAATHNIIQITNLVEHLVEHTDVCKLLQKQSCSYCLGNHRKRIGHTCPILYRRTILCNCLGKGLPP